MGICGYVSLTVAGRRTHLTREMSIVRESDVVCAAGHLCNAADNLRAVGPMTLADAIEALIATIDAEFLLTRVAEN
jgi:hypothetical protein